MSDKRSAFVIMPFDEEFETVYTEFIKPVLEEIGFSVERADDIESQQNILRDIVEQINKSDLIVADLTSVNPNVFYELGLAHAFQKQVILITQSIDEIPFDLKSYRLLEYSTHFVHIEEAKKKLTSYGKGFKKGTVLFGSPVTDFYRGEAPSHQAMEGTHASTLDEDDRGFLDHVIALNDGYSHIAKIVAGVANDQQVLTQHMETASKKLTTIAANPNASSPTAARNVSRRLANRLTHFNTQLKKANSQYASIAQETENSLEFLVSYQLEHSQATESSSDEQMASLLYILRDLKSKAVGARDAYLGMAEMMAQLPQVERRLNREVMLSRSEILVMAGNFDKTIASISRVLRNYT